MCSPSEDQQEQGRGTSAASETLRKVQAPLRAIIYIPPGVNVARWEKACYKHCARREYEVIGLTIDEDGSKWADVHRTLGLGQTDVIVVFDWHALPGDRLPRVEEVGVESTGDQARHRRPRLFRRSRD